MPIGPIVMILLGCGDAGDQCDRLAPTPVTYASVEQCNAAMARVLPTQSNIAYPVIGARCEPAPAVQMASR